MTGLKLDTTILLGFGLAIASLVASVLIEGGSLAALVSISAAILVIGGTVGATIISFPKKDLLGAVNVVRTAFTRKDEKYGDLVTQIVELGQFARREGLLALETRLEETEDRFLRQGLQLVVDGVDPELVRGILETELSGLRTRHRQGAGLLETAGGYAPTMGIIGTVMGLVHVLANLTNAAELGPGIAVAFLATFYGISTANLFWLPVAGRLKALSHVEMVLREIAIEGVLSIQAGDNPRSLEQKLLSFVPPGERQTKEDTGEVR